MQETRDKGAYRLVVGAIGLALIVALAGICLILAFGPECNSECGSSSSAIPGELWKIVSALGGGLLGILAPQPTKRSTEDKAEDTGPPGAPAEREKQLPDDKSAGSWRALAGKEIKGNLTVSALLGIFVLAAGFSLATTSTGLQSLAAASGAALLGLLAPSPAHTDLERSSA